MTRLTHSTYCDQRDFVRNVLLHAQPAWVRLLPSEQWDLYDFFAPTKTLSDAQLREHRHDMTVIDRSLPQRAGRAFKKLERALAVHVVEMQAQTAQPGAAVVKKTKRQSNDQVVTVRSLVHTEPDVARMTKALLALAREMVEADRTVKITDDVDHDSTAA